MGGGLATCVGNNSTLLPLEGNTSAEALRYAFAVVLLNGVKSHEGMGILDFCSEGTALLVGRVSKEEEEEAAEERKSTFLKLTIRMRRCTM